MGGFRVYEPEDIVDEAIGNFLFRMRIYYDYAHKFIQERTGIKPLRLREIEQGEGKGITEKELQALCRLYKLDYEMTYKRAVGELL